jgi:cytochrome P450
MTETRSSSEAADAAMDPPEVFYDHNGPENVADRAAAHRALSEKCPVVHSPAYDGYYIATGFEQVSKVLRRASEFVNRASVTIPPTPMPFGMVWFDPPKVQQWRQAIGPSFTSVVAEDLRERTRALVAEHIDRFASVGRADLVDDLVQPVPAISTLAALGLPMEQFSRYVDLFHRVNQVNPLHDGPEVVAAIESDVTDLLSDVQSVVSQRYADPQDDWASLFLQLEYGEGKRLPEDEVIGSVLLTFAGGVDTTAQLTAWTLYRLGKDPELRERLRADRSLLKPAFDEFLRFDCPVQGIARLIPEDTELNEFMLHSGKRIWIALAAANRDPGVFSDPDVIDIDRNAKRHLGFGAGPHRCLGSHIARLWWEEMVSAVLDRIPDYVIDDENVQTYPAGAINGLTALPVTFSAESTA